MMRSYPAIETGSTGGTFATTISFRFSAKYTDAETGLLYYGYRYYQPSTGRWLSRDPQEEQGGVNLYTFAENVPVNLFDYLGLQSSCSTCHTPKELQTLQPKKHCKLKSGPSYEPNGVIKAVKSGGRYVTPNGFRLLAEFEDDETKGFCAGCCEVRQLITWDKGDPGMGNPFFTPIQNFPRNKPYEDRGGDLANPKKEKRYGHRSGKYSDGSGYYNSNGEADMKNGVRFKDQDFPWIQVSPWDHGARWFFKLIVIDRCNGGDVTDKTCKVVGEPATVTIQWP